MTSNCGKRGFIFTFSFFSRFFGIEFVCVPLSSSECPLVSPSASKPRDLRFVFLSFCSCFPSFSLLFDFLLPPPLSPSYWHRFLLHLLVLFSFGFVPAGWTPGIAPLQLTKNFGCISPSSNNIDIEWVQRFSFDLPLSFHSLPFVSIDSSFRFQWLGRACLSSNLFSFKREWSKRGVVWNCGTCCQCHLLYAKEMDSATPTGRARLYMRSSFWFVDPALHLISCFLICVLCCFFRTGLEWWTRSRKCSRDVSKDFRDEVSASGFVAFRALDWSSLFGAFSPLNHLSEWLICFPSPSLLLSFFRSRFVGNGIASHRRTWYLCCTQQLCVRQHQWHRQGPQQALLLPHGCFNVWSWCWFRHGRCWFSRRSRSESECASWASHHFWFPRRLGRSITSCSWCLFPQHSFAYIWLFSDSSGRRSYQGLWWCGSWSKMSRKAVGVSEFMPRWQRGQTDQCHHHRRHLQHDRHMCCLRQCQANCRNRIRWSSRWIFGFEKLQEESTPCQLWLGFKQLHFRSAGYGLWTSMPARYRERRAWIRMAAKYARLFQNAWTTGLSLFLAVCVYGTHSFLSFVCLFRPLFLSECFGCFPFMICYPLSVSLYSRITKTVERWVAILAWSRH